eukprot:COSAG02_NODE_2168_length_9608_cov_38.056893_12_plen_220_part_00
MGRDGRGYSRARDVPCSDPDAHLTLSDKDNCDRYWKSDPNAVHFDLSVGRELNRVTDDAAKPGPGGWCVACDPCRQFTDGRLQAPSYTIPLDAHVGPWPEHWERHEAALRLEPSAPPQRARKVQLPWCDGLYRCVHCCPKGQTRPIGSKQCSNPAAHMPLGLRRQYVHFLSPNPQQNALRSGDRPLLEVFSMRPGGCGRCASDGLACPPSPRLTRWGGR